MLLLLLGACTVQGELLPKDDSPAPFDSGDSPDPDTHSEAPPAEDCNGLDDDGDGEVDEGFPDADADGLADCVDGACTLEVPAAGEVEATEACDDQPWTPPASPGAYRVEWARGDGEILENPVVGRLRDTDGDGDVDGADLPDILVSDVYTGELWRLAGDGSDDAVLLPSVAHMATSLADLDGDGAMDIVTGRRGDGQVCAYTGDGAPRWCSADLRVNGGGSPVVADLDGDGALEVVSVGGVADALTGDLLAPACTVAGVAQPAVGDVDGDGELEVLCGRQLSRRDGTVIWDLATSPEELYGSTFVDVDLDGVPEVLALDLQRGLTLYSAAGELLAEARDDAAVWSTVCVGDVDGDGDAEIGVAHGQALNLYDGGLELLWRVDATDVSNDASCSMFDLDADGADEVLYAGETDLVVVRGDGSELLRWDGHTSGTGLEYPVVADVDLDGAAEIVLAESYGNRGVVVLGHDGAGWAPADPWYPDGWGVSERLTPDGRLNPDAPPPWAEGGRMHHQRAGTWDPARGQWRVRSRLPDLSARVVDVCVASCEAGPVRVAVEVENRGAVDTRGEVVLWRVDGTGETEVGRQAVELPAGRRLDGLVFETSSEPEWGWRVELTGAGEDCAPGDEQGRWEDRICP